jgi:hypothetical protein
MKKAIEGPSPRVEQRWLEPPCRATGNRDNPGLYG